MNLGTTIIKGRRSVRKFRDTDIPEDAIKDALECARQAPTATNAQPWLIGIIRDRDTLARIADITDHGKFIRDARACFAVFGERKAKYYLEDCSCATMNLILGLWAYGVGSCWVAGDKKPYAGAIRELLGVPGGYTLVSLVPAGFPAEMPAPPKKDLSSIIFSERFVPR
ncbi:MAG TPA: nitroreductase family protein [Methanomicrobiales archaeon]|jgi:nitroreductase|nr:nitroreductase family protein [Methanomicrobiales archaeon]